MNPNIQNAILRFTGASRFEQRDVIQTLWSGYGEIVRLRLFDAPYNTVVVKYVSLPDANNHPRGWNTNISHQRKIRSYQVESQWYTHYAKQCDAQCRVPACLGTLEDDDQFIMVLEDLDATGFTGRFDYAQAVSQQAVHACIQWLAHFHARFLQLKPQGFCEEGLCPEGLWQEGSYWHLATRPDEYAALENGDLKHYAATISTQLAMCPWQTFIHGDAKLANFCFADSVNDEAPEVAAVDFQYVGAGCGIKDVAYFISSCYEEADCARLAPKLLDDYFNALRQALKHYQNDLSPADIDAIEHTWRALYPVAYTDFYRFLQGWSPGHWKLHRYSEQLAQQTLAQLKQQPQALSAHLPALLHTAVHTAKAAGDIIARNANKSLEVMNKNLGGSKAGDVLTEVDLQCQALIAARLAPFCQQFGIAFVGEESLDHSARLNAEYSWLVDPIDGTLPFIEQREGYAVCIALINRAGEPLLGVVYDAYKHVLYGAARGCELQLPVGNKLDDTNKIACYLDASYHADSRYKKVLDQLHNYALHKGFEGVDIKVGLGAALNACRMLNGLGKQPPALFLKLPKEKGGSLWDYAASAAIFKALGLPVSDIFGAPLDLNREDSTYLNHKGVLYASNATLADFIIETLKTLNLK